MQNKDIFPMSPSQKPCRFTSYLQIIGVQTISNQVEVIQGTSNLIFYRPLNFIFLAN